jgi:ferredoxin-NADP reductase
MTKLTLRLAAKSEVAHKTMSFRFDLNGKTFPFKPGQSIQLTLVPPPREDEKDNERTFSIASSPNDAFVLVATRMTGSAFKKTLAKSPNGAPVTIAGPEGSFVLDADNRRPVAMFAGGIGITPFRSMIKFAREENLPRHLTLIYSNRTPEDAPFLEELQRWGRDNANFRLIATMTEPEKSKRGWNKLTGYVDANFVRENLADPSQFACYVSGPPKFVRGISRSLRAVGVKKQNLHTDEFTGY